MADRKTSRGLEDILKGIGISMRVGISIKVGIQVAPCG